jgi:hypothetical protein
MNLGEFTNKVIEQGIESAKYSYSSPKDANCLKGALAGFEACRGKDPDQLRKLLEEAAEAVIKARSDRDENFIEIECYFMEIEWVCNVVSSILLYNKMPSIVHPTGRGAMAAYRIMASEGCVAEEKSA